MSPQRVDAELQWIDDHIGGRPCGVDILMPTTYQDAGEAKYDADRLLPAEQLAFVRGMLDRAGVPALPAAEAAQIERDLVSTFNFTPGESAAMIEIALRHPIKLIVNALGSPPAELVQRAHARGIKVAALALGCEGAWCGSVWLKTVQSEVTPEIKARMFVAGPDDAVLTRSVTGKPCRTLRSAFTDAWDAPGAPDPLQAILWWGQGRTRVERVWAKEFLTYPVGQIVADMREETSVRQVVQDMLGELAEAKERLDRLLG
jgi:NAD(P)H-dependent flavin oxidoreductase YrpB (nitropropane dioxygenase family)